MSAAFVPTFTRYLRREGQAAAWRLGSQVINGLILVTGVIVVLGIVMAEPLVTHYASGFAGNPEKLRLTVTLTRIVLPFLTLVAVAAACMGMLNGLRHFFVPAASPALYNVFFILSTLVLTPLFMRTGIEPVFALAIAMLVGGVAQIAVQWPTLRKLGYRHQWVLDPYDRGLREMLLLIGPGSIGAAAAQINLLVNTSLATSHDGAASAIQYAFRLIYMPVGIFSVSVATAAIPEIARHAADHDETGLRRTLSWALRLTLMLSVPASLGLLVLAAPIVELIFQRGQFDVQSTALTSGALTFYAPGIIGYSVVKIVTPSFYALRDARTPIISSLITVVVNLGLNLYLNAAMGFRGLALGSAIAANINAGMLLFLLSHRIGGIETRRVMISLAKILVASLLMAAVSWWVQEALHVRYPAPVMPHRLLRVLGAIGAGLATLAGAAWVLRIEEWQQAIARLRGGGAK